MVPPAALCIHLCIGEAYAFSVFNLPMTKLVGISRSAPSDWKLTQLGWIFSIAIFVLGVSAAAFGRWVEEGGKHGVIGLTKTAALEYAQKNIRVNCVCPGAIQTPMTARIIDSGQMNEDDVRAFEPVGRWGQPSEIGEGVVWLLSDASSFVTGHSMVIDGGWVAR